MIGRVRAKLKSLDFDPDPVTLPGDPAEFSFLARLIVGPPDSPGEESFDITVCTPEWLAQACNRVGGIYDPPHHDYNHRSWMAARYGAFCWPEVPIAAITPPTLIIVGSREDPHGQAPAWVATLPDARCETIPERTHCGTFLATAQCLTHAIPFLDNATHGSTGLDAGC
jgi:pimeloyl-ACP methyl ester carboxylesterase